MRVFGLGMPELLIILAVVLLIFGPKHLPKLGAALGSTVKSLRQGLGSNKSEAVEEITEEAEETPLKSSKALNEEAGVTSPKRKTRAKTAAPIEE